jgi:cation transport protein ChaC
MSADPRAAALALRQRLADKDFLALVRDAASAGVGIRTQDDLEATLHEILARHAPGRDLHVFAYGSLMWNPALAHSASFKARLHGWHRCYCIRSLFGRGTPEHPGLMLALERGGSCNGMLLRIAAEQVNEQIALLWRREMPWGAYEARWVTAWSGEVQVRAVTFVVDRRHERYVKGLPATDTARLIDSGQGGLGSSRAYFDATIRKMKELGIEDRRMNQLDALLRTL